jgi:hypothetical protein
MASGIAFKVKKNRFPEAPKLMRKAVGKGFSASEDDLLADMNRRTPVDEGDLRDSNKVYSDEFGLHFESGGGLKRPYAEHVHQGTTRMMPRPYMRDTIEANFPGVVVNIVNAAGEELK